MKKKEELDLIKSVEAGEWSLVPDFEYYKAKLQDTARQTLLKDARINIRLSKQDVSALKTKALEEGMPYQTLVASVLHKYVNGKLVEK